MNLYKDKQYSDHYVIRANAKAVKYELSLWVKESSIVVYFRDTTHKDLFHYQIIDPQTFAEQLNHLGWTVRDFYTDFCRSVKRRLR